MGEELMVLFLGAGGHIKDASSSHIAKESKAKRNGMGREREKGGLTESMARGPEISIHLFTGHTGGQVLLFFALGHHIIPEDNVRHTSILGVLSQIVLRWQAGDGDYRQHQFVWSFQFFTSCPLLLLQPCLSWLRLRVFFRRST